MKKRILVTYEVKAYEKKNDWSFKLAIGKMECRAKNKIEAINSMLGGYTWGKIYEHQLGYEPEKVEFEKIIDVKILKDAQ